MSQDVFKSFGEIEVNHILAVSLSILREDLNSVAFWLVLMKGGEDGYELLCLLSVAKA